VGDPYVRGGDFSVKVVVDILEPMFYNGRTSVLACAVAILGTDPRPPNEHSTHERNPHGP